MPYYPKGEAWYEIREKIGPGKISVNVAVNVGELGDKWSRLVQHNEPIRFWKEVDGEMIEIIIEADSFSQLRRLETFAERRGRHERTADGDS